MEANRVPIMTRNALAPLIVGAEEAVATMQFSNAVELLRNSAR
jgi:hypothetical protein